MWVYVLLVMRVYVLLVMRIRSVMGMGMPISSMVVPCSMVVSNMVMPTVNRVPSIVTVLNTV